MAGCLPRLRLSIGRLRGLLPLAKVAEEVTLRPLETFLFYFPLSLSFALIFSLSLTHIQYQAVDKVELLLALRQGGSFVDLELAVP